MAWRSHPSYRPEILLPGGVQGAGVFAFWTVSHVSPTGTKPVAASPVLQLPGLRHTPH
jgi:hypothetical protein